MAESPSVEGLQQLGTVQDSRAYLRDIWSRRELAVALPVNELRRATSATRLGQLWYIINPLLLVGVYWIIFDLILSVDRGVGGNFLGFLFIGILFFQFSQRTVIDASGTLARNRGLIRSLQFPRILLPIGSTIGQFLELARASVVLVAVLLITGSYPDWRWLVIVPLLGLQSLLNLGLALLAARFGETVRDLTQALPHLFRVLFYMSGILFSVETLVGNQTVRTLFVLNPLYDVVTLARWSLMGLPAGWEELAGLTGWTVVLLAWGFRSFRLAESRIGST